MSDGGPAFPHPIDSARRRQFECGDSEGMSLRDYFAAAALNAMLNCELRRDMWASVEKLAQDAYKQADAMLAQREK